MQARFCYSLQNSNGGAWEDAAVNRVIQMPGEADFNDGASMCVSCKGLGRCGRQSTCCC